jgi:hypothetical protein
MGTDLFIRNPREQHIRLLTWKINNKAHVRLPRWVCWFRRALKRANPTSQTLKTKKAMKAVAAGAFFISERKICEGRVR